MMKKNETTPPKDDKSKDQQPLTDRLDAARKSNVLRGWDKYRRENE
jgi:hypothetical protein